MRGENQRVESRFVDDDYLRLVVRTSALNQGSGFVLTFYVDCKRILWLGISQRLCNIAAHEERLALLVGGGSDGSEHFVIKHLNLFHCFLLLFLEIFYLAEGGPVFLPAEVSGCEVKCKVNAEPSSLELC